MAAIAGLPIYVLEYALWNYRAFSVVLVLLEAVVRDLERVVGHGSPFVKPDNLATNGQQQAKPTPKKSEW